MYFHVQSHVQTACDLNTDFHSIDNTLKQLYV